MEQLDQALVPILALLGLIPLLVKQYTAHATYRSSHKKSQLEALEKISELKLSRISPEQALLVDSTLRHAYSEHMSLEIYNAIRNGVQPPTAMRHYRFVRPFVELTDSSNQLRYKRRWFLYDEKTKKIIPWRVTVMYGTIYFVASFSGLMSILLGAAAVGMLSDIGGKLRTNQP